MSRCQQLRSAALAAHQDATKTRAFVLRRPIKTLFMDGAPRYWLMRLWT